MNEPNSIQYKTQDTLGKVNPGGFGSFTSKNYITALTTINAVATTIAVIDIPLGTSAGFKISGSAVQISGSVGTAGDSACFLGIQGLIKNVAGTTSLVGSTGSPAAVTYSDGAAAAWIVSFSADNTNDQLKIQVTGEANKTIDWTVKVEMLNID